jgi:hypothetical protein
VKDQRGEQSDQAGVNVPTISRVLDDGTLVELVYDASAGTTSLAICRPGGDTTVEPFLELTSGERLVPYSARNNLIANECVVLPSDIGDFGDKRDLLVEIQAFVHRYVDLTPVFEAIVAHYVLLTWVYDAFSDLPYLRFRGDYGTGKTRALLTVGSLCYKPFFASGASTVSPIFHIQDAFQGTLILDEADFRFSDATAELTKVLNNGTTRGMPVLRTMTNRNRELNPQAFRVFGPKIIAMRESYADQALESRFLTAETSGRGLRTEIPVHLPESFKLEALDLRNKLLAWRFRSRFSVGPDPSHLPVGISPRRRQTSLALLSLIESETLRSGVTAELAGEDARALDDRAGTLEAVMLLAITQSFATCEAPHATIRDVAERFNAAVSGDLGRPMSNRWIGQFVRHRLRLSTMKSGGVYVLPATEKPKVDALAVRFGVSEAA